MASRKMRALGMLLVSGAIAGFCLSSGSAHYFGPAADRAGGGGGGSEAGGGGGGGGKQASQHGGIQPDGNGQKVAGAAGGSSGAAAAAEKAGAIEDGEQAPPVATPAATIVSVNEISDFLAGNTIQRLGRDGQIFPRYMSRHGWQADAAPAGHDVLVHRWLTRANQLCEVVTEQSVACDALTITREAKPGPELGARLGAITLASGATWPVLRGNVTHMPEVMPLIDGVRRLQAAASPAAAGPAAAKPAATKGAMAKGAAVFKSIVGHPLIREGEAVRGLYYDPDGRWVSTRPIDPAARTGLGGIRVTIGQWAVRDGALCVDEPGLDLARTCYAAEQVSEAAFRLTPRQAGAAIALAVLAEGA